MADRTAREMGIAVFLLIVSIQFVVWVVKHFWRELICIGVAAYLLDYTLAHFFSPMTRDMSKEISEQYKKVQIVGYPVVEYALNDHNEPAHSWYRVTQISELRLSVRNDTKGRITSLTVACHGHTSKRPPDTERDGNDQAYPMVEENFQMTRKLFTLMIEPGQTQTVLYGNYDHALPSFESDEESLSCKPVAATFVDSDFYRAAHEMDRYSTATLADHLLSRPSVRPVTYQGFDYPIYVSGPIKNVGSKTARLISIDCLYEFDGPELDERRYKNLSADFKVNIEPGQTVQFSDKLVMPNNPAYSNKPISSTCHIGQVQF